MSRTLADAAARERIRADLDTTFVVEAAAGTGKTTALVDRVVASLAAGRSTLDRTVVVIAVRILNGFQRTLPSLTFSRTRVSNPDAPMTAMPRSASGPGYSSNTSAPSPTAHSICE